MKIVTAKPTIARQVIDGVNKETPCMLYKVRPPKWDMVVQYVGGGVNILYTRQEALSPEVTRRAGDQTPF